MKKIISLNVAAILALGIGFSSIGAMGCTVREEVRGPVRPVVRERVVVPEPVVRERVIIR